MIILTKAILIFCKNKRFCNNAGFILIVYIYIFPIVFTKNYSSFLLSPMFHWVPNKPELIVPICICKTSRYRTLKHAQNSLPLSTLPYSVIKYHQMYFMTSATTSGVRALVLNQNISIHLDITA